MQKEPQRAVELKKILNSLTGSSQAISSDDISEESPLTQLKHPSYDQSFEKEVERVWLKCEH